MKQWYNDYTTNESYFGMNDASIELFEKNQMDELVREMIQNSLDAVNDEKKPIMVTLEKVTINNNEFPNVENFNEKLEQSKKLSKENKDENTFEKIDGIKKIVRKSHINCLLIRDYNTTGLTKVKDGNGSFNALLNTSGFSYKSSQSGGSFGFGKNASFLFSSLRTVFYSTFNYENERGFQGISILSSGKEGKKISYPKKMYPQKPIIDSNIPFAKLLERNHIGTDILITGFDRINWEIEAIIAVIYNFFYAIKLKQLVVKVEKVKIDHRTIENIINKLYIKLKNEESKYSAHQKKTIQEAYHYVHLFNIPPIEKAIIVDKKIYIVKLHLNMEVNLPTKKVLGIRKIGMKVHEFKYFSYKKNLLGILYTQEVELNEILREMENPTHTKWEAARSKRSQNFGRTILKKLKDIIVDEIDIYTENNLESIKLESLDNLFKLTDRQKKDYQKVVIKNKRIRQSIKSNVEKTRKVDSNVLKELSAYGLDNKVLIDVTNVLQYKVKKINTIITIRLNEISSRQKFIIRLVDVVSKESLKLDIDNNNGNIILLKDARQIFVLGKSEITVKINDIEKKAIGVEIYEIK